MAKKVRDYAKLAADIKDTIGESNIMTATHCATRLRLVLKENPTEAVTKKSSRCPVLFRSFRQAVSIRLSSVRMPRMCTNIWQV